MIGVDDDIEYHVRVSNHHHSLYEAIYSQVSCNQKARECSFEQQMHQKSWQSTLHFQVNINSLLL